MLRLQMLVHRVFGYFKDEEGATAIEYGLLAALISVAIIVAVGYVGSNLNIVFNNVASKLSAAV